MSSRATGRRLLVARAHELPQIRANQDRSLEMSPTWLPLLFFLTTHMHTRVQRVQNRAQLYTSIQSSAISSSDLLAFSCLNYFTLNILMCLFNLMQAWQDPCLYIDLHGKHGRWAHAKTFPRSQAANVLLLNNLRYQTVFKTPNSGKHHISEWMFMPQLFSKNLIIPIGSKQIHKKKVHFKLLRVFYVYILCSGVLLIIQNKLFREDEKLPGLPPAPQSPVLTGSQNKYRSNFPMAGDLWRQIGEINK